MKNAIALLILMLAAASANAACELSAADREAIRGATDEYVAAWLANDEARVMALLAPDVVLMPPPGVAAKVGREAARDFWFPRDSPPFVITAFEQDIDDVVGCGDIAVVRGRQKKLEWNYDGRKYRNLGSNFVSTYEKNAVGEWHLRWQIWSTVGTEEVKVLPRATKKGDRMSHPREQ